MIIDGTMERALADASIDGNKVVLTEQLARKDYLRVNEILETLGGKWSRKDKAHVFPEEGESLRGLIEAVIATGEIKTAREQQKALGWFPTPPDVADRLIEFADIQPRHTVLEPSAGEGAIVGALVEKGVKDITTVEIDPGRHKLLRKRFPEATHIFGDFLYWKPEDNEFDRIVMNPPFGPHLAHIEHALHMLAPGGTLVSVVPASFEHREDKRHAEIRRWIERDARTWGVWSLPDNSFKDSGTNVNASVLVLAGWRL